MTKLPLTLLLLVTACGAADDSEVSGPATRESPDGGVEPPPGPDASGPPLPPQEGALLPLAWAFTGFDDADDQVVQSLDWGPDGSLVSGTIIDDRPNDEFAPVTRIDRFDADGGLVWSRQIAFDDFPDFPLPEGDGVEIGGRAVDVSSIDHAADGTILVALTASLFFFDYNSGATTGESTRNYIRSYDAQGIELGSIEMGGVTNFPFEDNVDELAALNTILALPDGSIAWTGLTSRGPHPSDGWSLLGEGSIGRVAADGTTQWTVVLGQELDSPNMVAPPEEVAVEIQPTADGGLIVRGHYFGTLTIGDLTASSDPDSSSTYVARLELDGSATWLATVPDAEPIAAWFSLAGMGLGEDGALFTAGYDFGGAGYQMYQIDPAGQIVSQVDIAETHTLSVGGGHIATGGSVYVDLGDHESAWPGRVQVLAPDGTVLASRVLVSEPVLPRSSSRPAVIAVSPEGRVAVGGRFDRVADFGAGPVTVPPDTQNGFIAVYETSGCGETND